MIILSICAILFCVLVIDAFIVKFIQQKEADKLLSIQHEYNQLQTAYKKKISLLQKLRTQEKSLQAAKQKAPQTQPGTQQTETPETYTTGVAVKLLEQGIITPEQFKKAQKYQQGTGTGKPIEEILVLLGAADQKTIDALSRR